MARVAAITIVYNEALKLPRWIDYYSRQLGPTACYVIDHGSDDGSTDEPHNCQIIKIPRTQYDNKIRVEAISSLSHFLLKYYDFVLYTDADEFIVADPDMYAGLGDLCNTLSPDYMYSVGVDVVHKIDEEAPLKPGMPVTLQRTYAHFTSAMCKPNLTRLSVNWAPGFHSHQHPPQFNGLFNFHLRYVDLDEGLNRLEITRNLNWAKSSEGAHHKAPNSQFESLIKMWGNLPVISSDPFKYDDGILRSYIESFCEKAAKPDSSNHYNVDTFTFGKELLRIPNRFKGIF